ncbi:MAG: DUF2993 domain-containing protein [Pseudonocardia sp.]|nr:DUF2993 domain-containing protein [Pseudonocardia sp.]
MRRLVIGLLVLAGLLVTADFGAAALAESAVSRQMREQLALPDDPSVRINGFPFLTQALAGRYSSIDIDAERITVGDLREVQINARLDDVAAPLPMLLGSGPKSLLVTRAEGSVRIGANDVERLVPGLTGTRIETVDADALAQAVEEGGDASLADIDPDRAARFVGTYTLLGQELEVAVIAVLELTDGQAEIAPRDVRLADGTPLPIPSSAQRAILGRFSVPIDTGSLPLQVTPRTFLAREGMLEISGTASDLVLGAPTPA